MGQEIAKLEKCRILSKVASLRRLHREVAKTKREPERGKARGCYSKVIALNDRPRAKVWQDQFEYS